MGNKQGIFIYGYDNNKKKYFNILEIKNYNTTINFDNNNKFKLYFYIHIINLGKEPILLTFPYYNENVKINITTNIEDIISFIYDFDKSNEILYYHDKKQKGYQIWIFETKTFLELSKYINNRKDKNNENIIQYYFCFSEDLKTIYQKYDIYTEDNIVETKRIISSSTISPFKGDQFQYDYKCGLFYHFRKKSRVDFYNELVKNS